jgi:hypothetical protein
MDKVQATIFTDYNTPSSESFRLIYETSSLGIYISYKRIICHFAYLISLDINLLQIQEGSHYRYHAV